MSGFSLRKLFLLFWVNSSAPLFVATALSATTLAQLKFDDLVSQSAAVARVHCLRTGSHWSQGEIWTRTEFVVVEGNKGTLPRIVEVQMPGGVFGHLHSRVEEVPAFVPGEEAYLFLWPAPDGAYRILGWSQGAFRIRKNSATGVEMVTQDSANAPLFDPITRKFRHGGVRNLPVAVFQLKLKRALERQ